jgi:hypothetical protein
MDALMSTPALGPRECVLVSCMLSYPDYIALLNYYMLRGLLSRLGIDIV